MILIYGFGPYGLVSRNISEEIVNDLWREYEFDKDLKFIVLPTNQHGITALESMIQIKKPKIIIGMGHLPLSRDFRIEVCAYEETKKIVSEIAGYVALSTGIKLTDKIGDYFCNRAYYSSLKKNKKSLFIHIGAKANERIDILNKINEIIKICKADLKGGN